MKKEKWILGEIDSWEREEIIDAETAGILKSRYVPKKKLNLLIVLFSIIGTLFVGLGLILVGAHNLWYKLPIAARTVIGLLPLIVSQIIVVYVFVKKKESVAFREGAAILNVTGVFSSVAIVGQIFHLPSDFTNYILLCGVMFLPSMALLNAVSPLAIYFWAILNGGLCFVNEWDTPLTILLYGIGVAFACCNFKKDNAKSVYVAWITAIAGFILFWSVALIEEFDAFISLFSYFVLLVSVSALWDRVGKVFKGIGVAGVLALLFFASFEGFWEYLTIADVMLVIISAAILILSAVLLLKKRSFNPCVIAAYIAVIMRAVGVVAKSNSVDLSLVFAIAINILLLAVGVWYIWNGAQQINLTDANIGMLTVCALIVARFFDSEMSLGIRGLIFILLGAGFLFVNLRLVKLKKKTKGEEQ